MATDVDSDEKGTSTENDGVGSDDAKEEDKDEITAQHDIPESLFKDLSKA